MISLSGDWAQLLPLPEFWQGCGFLGPKSTTCHTEWKGAQT